MMKILAKTISYVLHPFLMPIYALLFLFSSGSMFALIPRATQIYCYIVTLFVLLLMPMLSLPLFKRLQLIRDFHLEDKQERVYPILVTVAFTFFGFWLLGRVAYTHIVQQLYWVLIILLSVFSVVTLRWKMSMHMTAMGGLCGFLLVLGMKYPGDMRGSFIFVMLLAGLLAASRLYLNKHNPLQVYVGFLFGALAVWSILF